MPFELDEGVAAVVGGLGGAVITVVGGLITSAIAARRRAPSVADDATKVVGIADIKGTWVATAPDMEDIIEITGQSERRVEGCREFKGADGVWRKYSVTGYFDGVILALAITSFDAREIRTLSFVARRIASGKLCGVRTHLSGDRVKSTVEYTWVRRTT